MMKKFFSAVGHAITFTKRDSPIRDGFSPYGDKECDALYNTLFCDKLDVLRAVAKRSADQYPEDVWSTLLAEVPYAAGLKAIADNQSQTSRARVVAHNRLREIQQPVPSKKLLGVVIELGLQDGLDVLAAYPDGCVRYINHKESIASFDPVPAAWMANVRKLMNAAQSAVDQIGPWGQPRVAPPTLGMIRMSFLVSDGLYFGQGVMSVMEQDDMAKPIIQASVDLLKTITKTAAAAVR